MSSSSKRMALSQLPLDIIILFAKLLGVKDLISLSAVDRNLYEHIQALDSIWRSFAAHAIESWGIAPHSIEVGGMSAHEARNLISNPHRLELLLSHIGPHAVSGTTAIDMSAISAETTLSLRIPDGSSVVEWCAFPGNRWVCAALSLENSIMQLSLWDVQSPNEIEGIPPVSSISSDNTSRDLAQPCELWPQFDEINKVVNILLYFLTDSEYILEVYQLIWTNGIPAFTREAYRRHSRNIWITSSFHKAWLDGDYVCIRCQDGIVLWNWQQDTNGFIHTETSSAPLLFQLPFIGGYEDSPELYSIDLHSMGPNSSRYPLLEQKPADIKVLRRLEGIWYMTAMAFGRRWTIPVADYPALGRKDVLLCDSTQQTTGTKATLVSTWNHSARSLEYAPPIKSFTPRRYDSHLILPSGTILLDQDVSEISAREAVGIQVCGGKMDATDSGKRTLRIPLPPSMNLSTLSPTATNLCPFSGTLLVRVHLGEPSNKEFIISCPRILALS